MYIHSVWSWSIISNNDAKPRKIKPKGIKLLLFIVLNFLIDFIPIKIGTTNACKWAKNKVKKNKFNFKFLLFKNFRKI